MAAEALSRRAILKNGTLFLAGSLVGGWPLRSLLPAAPTKPALRVGLVTDLHYADKNPSGTRHYRESLAKLREAVERFNAQKVDLVVWWRRAYRFEQPSPRQAACACARSF